jgi:hypothetical protein
LALKTHTTFGCVASLAMFDSTKLTDLYNMDCVCSSPCHSKSEATKSAIFVVSHWKLLVLHQNTVGSRFSDIILSLVLLSSLISYL